MQSEIQDKMRRLVGDYEMLSSGIRSQLFDAFILSVEGQDVRSSVLHATNRARMLWERLGASADELGAWGNVDAVGDDEGDEGDG